VIFVSKTWFITGASRGFGRVWAEAALERGDRVAATARDTSTLDDLVERSGDAVLPIALDVTDHGAAAAAVKSAHDHFGRLDVVVNNAGYGHFGFVEELSEEEARSQLETNLFGALWVTQAAIPLLREQGAGHIVQVSSMGGMIALPRLGIYHASKWALEGLSEALAAELGPAGIKVTIVEPGPYATDWGGTSAVQSAPNPVYQEIRDMMSQGRASFSSPAASETTAAILALVDAQEPPLRLLLGNVAYDIVSSVCRTRLETWAAWEQTSRAAG
jgi:NAD(P)-dependent dehydrogenase (short-subunit alcohol dehydrogenase family)